MNFLGYCPYEPHKTWGEKLKRNRVYRGLTIKEMAKILHIDSSTLIVWEKLEKHHCKLSEDEIDQILEKIVV